MASTFVQIAKGRELVKNIVYNYEREIDTRQVVSTMYSIVSAL